jgi:WD40 repeat protein
VFNGAVKLWDVATAKERASFPFNNWIHSFALTADGKTLAVGGQPVTLWDVATGKERDFPAGRGSLVFTPDGKTLAVSTEGPFIKGRNDGLVKLWDVSTGKERATLKTAGPYCRVTISPDGKILAAVSGKAPGNPYPTLGSIALWNLPAGEERDTLSGGFTCVAFTPDGKTMLAGGEGIVLWDLATGQELATLKAHRGNVLSLALTADGKTLASAATYYDAKAKNDLGEVKLWDMESQRVRSVLKGFFTPPRSMAFAPDGKTLATFAFGEIKLWDIPVSKQAAK